MRTALLKHVITAGLAIAASSLAWAQTPIAFQLNWVAGGANAGFAGSTAIGANAP